MNQKLLALYGLKWNPFSPELPVDAIYVPQKIENFCWRIEHAQVREGGFAMIHGDPGSGKSIVLRLLAERLKKLPDITVGAINHPQSNMADFYRELVSTVMDRDGKSRVFDQIACWEGENPPQGT